MSRRLQSVSSEPQIDGPCSGGKMRIGGPHSVVAACLIVKICLYASLSNPAYFASAVRGLEAETCLRKLKMSPCSCVKRLLLTIERELRCLCTASVWHGPVFRQS